MTFIPPSLPAEPPFAILDDKLYMGMHQPPGALDGFDVVVGVAKEKRVHPWDHPNATVVHVPIVDEGPPSQEDWKLACETANLVFEHLEAGRRVYVGCSMGINRSAWVVALVLKKRGLDGTQAVQLIRERRGSIALTNQFFEALIRRT